MQLPKHGVPDEGEFVIDCDVDSIGRGVRGSEDGDILMRLYLEIVEYFIGREHTF